jgi:hypothetical protein
MALGTWKKPFIFLRDNLIYCKNTKNHLDWRRHS